MSKVEQKNIEPKTVDEVLASQMREILKRSGITDLYVEEDGSLTGTYTETLWPSSTEINNLRIVVNKRTNSIEIKGKAGKTSENTGSII